MTTSTPDQGTLRPSFVVYCITTASAEGDGKGNARSRRGGGDAQRRARARCDWTHPAC
jgi:hypothetical protein